MDVQQLIGWLLSPTRMFAKRQITAGRILDGAALRAWNWQFQFPTIMIAAILVLFPCITPKVLYWPLAYFAFGRVNELLSAFYSDALDKMGEADARLADLTKTDRVKLLIAGYAESILLFGLLHYAIQELVANSYKQPFSNVFDSIYFSSMTITTTGFGDFAPVSWAAKLATIYEAVIGIVFLALALASYLAFARSDRSDGDKPEEPAGLQSDIPAGNGKPAAS